MSEGAQLSLTYDLPEDAGPNHGEWVATQLRAALSLAGVAPERVRLRHSVLAEPDPRDVALREACLHQGLPLDAPPERIAAHFRNNREFREGFDQIARKV